MPRSRKASVAHFSERKSDILKEKKYGNPFAYFFADHKACRIDAEYAIDEEETQIATAPSAPRDDHVNWFLSPNRFVVSDDPAIIYISNTLGDGLHTDAEKARRYFDWVVHYLTYAHPIRGLYTSIQALTDRHVDCGGFSTLLVSLLRAQKIPARCVFGWAMRSKLGYHAWVEHYDRQQEKWIFSDPSVAQLGNKTKLDAGFGYCNDERVIFSVGEDLILSGCEITWPTPLLQSPIVVSLDGDTPCRFEEYLSWKEI